jgi:hypothetical protein
MRRDPDGLRVLEICDLMNDLTERAQTIGVVGVVRKDSDIIEVSALIQSASEHPLGRRPKEQSQLSATFSDAIRASSLTSAA